MTIITTHLMQPAVIVGVLVFYSFALTICVVVHINLMATRRVVEQTASLLAIHVKEKADG